LIPIIPCPSSAKHLCMKAIRHSYSYMMQKILVTTDFSANSKAGLRFAIQLSTQHNYELTFFHAYYIMKPTSWSDATVEAFDKREREKIQDKLNRFVLAVYESMKVPPAKMKCVILSSLTPDKSIMEYAAEKGFSFICISTRGAGKMRKVIGTNTSFLINHSPVPVIAVPSSYRAAPITSVLYASDLSRLDNELSRVVAFAKPLRATVELLHFHSPLDTVSDPRIITQQVKKISRYTVNVHLEKPAGVETFITNVEAVIKKTKPSMLVMFTEQHRSFFERLFLASKSAEYSFHAKVPLLVFNRL
jgi:nucleotide-binding universal stress UspA family protein